MTCVQKKGVTNVVNEKEEISSKLNVYKMHYNIFVNGIKANDY